MYGNTQSLNLVSERLLDLNENTMFVSSGSGYLKQCSEVRFENKIFFPLLHGDHNSVLFCFKEHKFFSYDYSTQRGVSNSHYLHIVKTISGVWIGDDFVLLIFVFCSYISHLFHVHVFCTRNC